MHVYMHKGTIYPQCVFTSFRHIILCVHVMLYVLYNTASKFGATDDEGDDDAVNSDWEDCRHTLLTH